MPLHLKTQPPIRAQPRVRDEAGLRERPKADQRRSLLQPPIARSSAAIHTERGHSRHPTGRATASAITDLAGFVGKLTQVRLLAAR